MLGFLATIQPPPGTETAPASLTDKAGVVWNSGETYASKMFPILTEYGLRTVGVLVILMLAWILASWVRRGLRHGLERAKFDLTLTKFVSNASRYVIFLIALITCLGVFGVNITAFAALIGAGGLAVGLGFQGALSNLAAGFMLLVTRPFRVGDTIVVEGFTGVVDEIELFSTKLNTFDNRRILMPNTAVFGKVIENVTYHPTRRITLDVGVSYTADLEAAGAAMRGAVAGVPLVLRDPAPDIFLKGFGASSIDWMVGFWCKREDIGAARHEVVRAVKAALDEAQIDIPFPQMDVRVVGEAIPAPSAGDGSSVRS